ncbi:hypothetical protein DFH07DRAFT_784119 [Mycena maculata]|uniref:DUF6534 domain-containing protein n=1 Tax=Mycena maculata TaxID=230809 RepID=A0AAD7MKB5_9AGAR|nr:hypothetical protein DFH07DRAFT_784119 [Mycena maculata]
MAGTVNAVLGTRLQPILPLRISILTGRFWTTEKRLLPPPGLLVILASTARDPIHVVVKMTPATHLLPAAVPDSEIVQVSGPHVNLGYWKPFPISDSYLYYQAFPNDRTFTKGLVYTVYLIEFVAIILFAHDAFSIYGFGFADPSAATKLYFPVAFGGQSFYAYRVHVLSKGLLIPCLIVAISLTGTVAAFVTGAYVLKGSRLNSAQAIDVTNLEVHRVTVAGGVWLGASAISDITIALTKSGIEFRRTRELVSRLTRLIIETGTLTAVVALVTMTLFLAFPRNEYYLTPAAILPELYANSILFILNSRMKIVGGRGTETSTTSDIMFTIPVHSCSTAGNTRIEQPPVIEIRREVSDADLHDQVEMKVMRGQNTENKTGFST